MNISELEEEIKQHKFKDLWIILTLILKLLNYELIGKKII